MVANSGAFDIANIYLNEKDESESDSSISNEQTEVEQDTESSNDVIIPPQNEETRCNLLFYL